MRIRILVPSDDYLQQAGVRIRYRRVEQALAAAGHELLFTDIRSVDNLPAIAADIVLISKCYEPRASLIANLLAATETRVGIDLFDDYFSQQRDSRLTRLRRWLREVSGSIDFILCSTPAMREVAQGYAGELPCHVLNDPAPEISVGALQEMLPGKLERVRSTRVLDIAWFGMGDNPYFPVGLSDLCGFGGHLARLRGQGFDLRLEVLTNVRALTTGALARLRMLPIPHTIEEWTPGREVSLLRKSFAAFLPVSAQSFSTVKSLNRGLTALTSGTQLLSAGYPLYEPLADFVYRDGLALLADIDRGTPLLRAETASALGELVTRWGDSDVEAQALLQFLRSVGKRPRDLRRGEPPLAAVIHGKNTTGDAHKLAQRTRTLSVASPYCDAKLNYDIRFRAAGEGLECLVSERLIEAYPETFLDRSSGPAVVINGLGYRPIAGERSAEKPEPAAVLARMDGVASLVASHGSVMAAIGGVMSRFFPGIVCLQSENARLPLAAAPAAPSSSDETR